MLGQIAEKEGGYEMQRYLQSISSHEEGLQTKDAGRGAEDTRRLWREQKKTR